MKSLFEYISESLDRVKEITSQLASYTFEPGIKGWGFKKDSYKAVKKGRGEFKISIKDASDYINGKDGYGGSYIKNLFIYLKGFEFEGSTYISVVFKSEDAWDGRPYNDDFCVLNSIDGLTPFIEWCFKPHRNATRSEIGPDGELKIWYEKMPKSYAPDVKQYMCDKRTVTKMGDLVKINCIE